MKTAKAKAPSKLASKGRGKTKIKASQGALFDLSATGPDFVLEELAMKTNRRPCGRG